MERSIAVNYPAAIPVGHIVELTRFADPRPERKRRGVGDSQAYTVPVLHDLDTGIRYMNHAHASIGGNGGNSFVANRYPFEPLAELEAAEVWRGRVLACTLVMVEGLENQHTVLRLAPLEEDGR